MPTLLDIETELLRPGAPFETENMTVLGAPARVFVRRPRSVRALLEASLAFGDREFIVYGGRRIGFAEHGALVASVAAALRDRFGVGKGDRVAILAANRPEWIVSYFAALSLGAVAVGLNGWWAGDEIVHGLEDSAPKLLIGDRPRLARVRSSAIELPVVEIESDFAALTRHALDASLPDTPIDEDDPATLLYTSGTTGRPKGVVNTHRNIGAYLGVGGFHGIRLLMWNAQNPSEDAPPPISPCMLVNAPLFHVSGLYAGLLSCLANGLKSVWPTGRFDAGEVLELIEREQVTNWGPMGPMMHRLLEHPDLGRRDLSTLRGVGSGGAPLSAELQEAMRRVFPNTRRSVGIGYGLTEATGLLTLIAGEELESHPRAVGRPLPTVEIEIRDAEGRPLPEGAEGEIHARGPMVMKEYWRNPEATAEVLAPGRWLRTGDVGRMEDGRLFIDSRKRDLILRGGENVYPGEIELCLESHPAVAEAAVLGVDHAELGQEVKAVVVAATGATPTAEALRAFVSERLAYFKVPAHWEIRRDPLPRNAAGKVLKQVLGGEGENPFAEP